MNSRLQAIDFIEVTPTYVIPAGCTTVRINFVAWINDDLANPYNPLHDDQCMQILKDWLIESDIQPFHITSTSVWFKTHDEAMMTYLRFK